MMIEDVARLDNQRLRMSNAYETLREMDLNPDEEVFILGAMNILKTKMNKIDEELREGVIDD